MGCDIYVKRARNRSDEGAKLFHGSYSLFMSFRNSVMTALGYQVECPLDDSGRPEYKPPYVVFFGKNPDTSETREFIRLFWEHQDWSGNWTCVECKRVLSVLETITTIQPWCDAIYDIQDKLEQFKTGLRFAVAKRRRVYFS